MTTEVFNLPLSAAKERRVPLVSDIDPESRLSDVGRPSPGPVTNARSDGDVVADKVILALARWARNKMGRRYHDYVRQAEETFLLEIAEKVKEEEGLNFWAGVRLAAEEVEIKFPKKLKRRSRRKLYELAPTLIQEYECLLREVKPGKNKVDRAERKRAMLTKLSNEGVSKERIESWCNQKIKPSEILYEFLTEKHSLDLNPDTLKKLLRVAKKSGPYRLDKIASILERTLLKS